MRIIKYNEETDIYDKYLREIGGTSATGGLSGIQEIQTGGETGLSPDIVPGSSRGTGEIIGADTREEAAKVYAGRIRQYPNWENKIQGFNGTGYGARISNLLNKPTDLSSTTPAPSNPVTSIVQEAKDLYQTFQRAKGLSAEDIIMKKKYPDIILHT